MWASSKVLVDLFPCYTGKELPEFRRQCVVSVVVVLFVRRCQCIWEGDLSHRRHKRHNFYAISKFEVFFGDGTGRDATLRMIRTRWRRRIIFIPIVSRALLR